MAITKVTSGLISADAASVDLNIDAGTLYIDATNNRVGIANTSPSVALDVTGAVTVSGEITANGGIALGDSDKATFGASDDLQIYHDGSNSLIQDAGTGDLILKSNGTATVIKTNAGSNLISARDAGSVGIFYNGSEKLTTTAGGVSVTGTVDATGTITVTGANNNIRVGTDTGKFLAGASNDLQIYHDGSNSFIKDAGTGLLYLLGGSGIIMQNPSQAETYLTATVNNKVELYYDNSPKLATTSTGIDVTGTVSATEYHISGTEVLDHDGNYTTLLDPTAHVGLFLGGTGDTGNYYDNNTHYFRTRGDAQQVVIDSTKLNIVTGVLQINGTTVIDTSRNLTNIGTISSTGLVTIDANGTVNPLHIHDDSTGGQAGMVVTDTGNVGTSTQTFYAKQYGSAIGGSLFGQTLGGKAFVGTEGSASGGLLIGTATADNVWIGTNNTTALTIDTSQNATFAGDITVSSSSPLITLTDSDNSLSARINGASGNLYLNSHNVNRDVFIGEQAGGAVNMTILGDGNVGIGTTNPITKLHVEDNTSGSLLMRLKHSTAGHESALRFQALSSTSTQEYADIALDPQAGDGALVFRNPYTSERMRIDGDGDVGIGVTNPVHKLSVAGNNSGYLVKFFNDGGLANRAGLHIQAGADSGDGTTVYLRVDDGNGDFTGELKTVSGVFQLNDVSDERLKQDIVDTSINGLEAVNNMRIVDFAYKKNPSKTIQAGFIAQELQEVFAPAVSESTEYEEGAESYLGVSRERLVPVLVKAIQELKEENDNLKARIEVIENG